ncbi:MAG: hypothetical protein AUH72_12375 [Acidobacteria bacterium 13_1_40CM_4_65_8]|nr:MAG: hypothetical protein AUH72_12375 [Acidobacteria bacterium 13_1_40CM_4_65_8]
MMIAIASAQATMRGTCLHEYSDATAGDRQNPFSSHNRCAPSTAANNTPTTPMPRPATMSSLTPASWSARRTPA